MTVQERYDEMIANGVSPLLAEMLALQQPPGIGGGTERTFFENKAVDQFSDMPEWMAKGIMAKARAAGVVTAGKIYKPSLADSRGPADPQAWVSDLHDVKRVCIERNYHADGAVKHVAPEVAPKRERLAPDIVSRLVKREQAKAPFKKHSVNELREKVIEKHGSKG